MKSIKKEDDIKIRKSLAVAYREKEKALVGELWQGRVMVHIQNLGSLYPKTSFFELFQQFVWRLAPVTCALVFFLGVALAQRNFVSDYELTKIFIGDPADFSMFTLFDR